MSDAVEIHGGVADLENSAYVLPSEKVDLSVVKTSSELQENDRRRERLQLIILPTERCNFRCLYCYEDFGHGAMTPQILGALTNLLKRIGHQLLTLEIDWFGGEPLLAYDYVKKVMRYVEFDMPKEKRMRLISGMSTNGFLLSRERLFELTNLGVDDFQISFDGDKYEHDKLRVLSGGSPTFDQIWKNVLAAHDSFARFNMTLRIHLNQMNSQSARELLSRMSRSLGSDPRFAVFIRPLSKLGSSSDSFLPVLDEEEGLSVTEELQCFARERGLRVVERPPNFSCYASDPNSFVLRADGTIAKCTVALYDERNSVGRLLPNGRLELDEDKIRWWTRGRSTGNEAELRCPLKSVLVQSTESRRKDDPAQESFAAERGELRLEEFGNVHGGTATHLTGAH